MKKIFSLILLSILICNTIIAQIGTTITPDRRGDWTNAGYTGAVPTNYDHTLTVINASYSGIMDKLDEAKDLSGRVLVIIPQSFGTINIEEPITLDSQYNNITIRGEVIGDTIMPELNFIVNTITNANKYIDSEACFKLSNINNFGIEDIEITSENMDIENYPDLNPELGFNIIFQNSTECWVKGIRSYYPIRQHIEIRGGSHIEIRENLFRYAFSYGESGSGYGVTLTWGATLCLVEDNIFRELRHSMVVAGGAQDNVFGYNYSCVAHGADISIHGGSTTSKNLFEGNRIDEIRADMYHGTNGEYNTFFRNFCYYGEIFVETEAWAINPSKYPDPNNPYGIGINKYSIVGNEAKTKYVKIIFDGIWSTPVTKPDNIIDIYGNAFDGGVDSHGNWINNYENDYVLEDVSYYLSRRPSFINANSFSWPPLGPPTSSGNLTTQNIPARKRACDELGWSCTSTRFPKTSSDDNGTDVIEKFKLGSNYPNPFNPVTNIRYQLPDNSMVKLIVYNSLGQQVAELVSEFQIAGYYTVPFSGANLSSGIYYYTLTAGQFTETKKMILMK